MKMEALGKMMTNTTALTNLADKQFSRILQTSFNQPGRAPVVPSLLRKTTYFGVSFFHHDVKLIRKHKINHKNKKRKWESNISVCKRACVMCVSLCYHKTKFAFVLGIQSTANFSRDISH